MDTDSCSGIPYSPYENRFDMSEEYLSKIEVWAVFLNCPIALFTLDEIF